MSRNISFMLTKEQFLDGSKDVTRRVGWLFAKADDIYNAAEKCQGLRKGEQIKIMGVIRLISVRREPLRRMTVERTYGRYECKREGFPHLTPEEFVEFFCRSHRGCKPHHLITRLEFERIK